MLFLLMPFEHLYNHVICAGFIHLKPCESFNKLCCEIAVCGVDVLANCIISPLVLVKAKVSNADIVDMDAGLEC